MSRLIAAAARLRATRTRGQPARTVYPPCWEMLEGRTLMSGSLITNGDFEIPAGDNVPVPFWVADGDVQVFNQTHNGLDPLQGAQSVYFGDVQVPSIVALDAAAAPFGAPAISQQFAPEADVQYQLTFTFGDVTDFSPDAADLLVVSVGGQTLELTMVPGSAATHDGMQSAQYTALFTGAPDAETGTETLQFQSLGNGPFALDAVSVAPVATNADLRVSLVTPERGVVNTPITTTVTVTNGGPDAVFDAALVVVLPAKATAVTTSAGQVVSSPDGTTMVNANTGPLAAGQSAVVTIQFTPGMTGLQPVAAAVSGDGVTDPNEANNMAGSQVNVGQRATRRELNRHQQAERRQLNLYFRRLSALLRGHELLERRLLRAGHFDVPPPAAPIPTPFPFLVAADTDPLPGSVPLSRRDVNRHQQAERRQLNLYFRRLSALERAHQLLERRLLTEFPFQVPPPAAPIPTPFPF